MSESDLKRAFDALKGKQKVYSDWWDYYYGDHPLVYSAKRLRKLFDKIDARFSENWCSVVVDSVLDRVQLEQFVVNGNTTATDRLNDVYKRTELDLDADEVHKATLVTGEAFVMAWRDENDELEAYYNDPRLCHVAYMPDNPRRKAWAAKWWQADEGLYRLNMYYADRIAYYEARSKNVPDHVSAFQLTAEGEAPNPFGVIPVFHFRRERRNVVSELKNIISIQAAVNKLLADMMVAAEFGAFKMRYVISNADNVGALKNVPNEILDIPAGDGVGQDTEVGEFSATDLSNYIKAIDNLAGAIATISRTPRHFFFDQGGDPSGEALMAMEAPLNKKCGRYVGRFGNTWQRLAAFLLQLEGVAVDAQEISVNFDKPGTVQPKTEAEIRETDVRSGIPLRTILRREGWSNDEIEAMEADRQEERTAESESLAVALVEQQRRFDRGEGEV